MAYSKYYPEGWKDNEEGGTPITAAALNNMETGISAAHEFMARTDNPHGVTKAQVGLGNAENTADANKEVKNALTLKNARTLDGVSFNGGANITHYATCSTAAATTAKTATLTGFTLAAGARITVKFTVTNTGAVGSLTLNVNSTGAKPIKYRGGNLPAAGTLAAGRVYTFMYDGTNYELVGDLDTNTQAVTGVKGDKESAYRTGNVNLTPANIGALPLSGGTLTGDLTLTSKNIKYQGSKAAYTMIGFIDNANDTYGNGVYIGGGGATIVGGGESAATIAADTSVVSNGGAEILVLANDSDIIFYSNIQSGVPSAKKMTLTAGGQLTLPVAPNANMSAATKQYVDGQISILREYLKSMEIYRTASGNPATFSDADAANVKALSVTITPTQSGSGDPSPTNIRPIIGVTSVSVTRTGENGTNPQTVNVQLTDGSDPLTVYGGTLNVTTGELTVTDVSMELDGSADEKWNKNTYVSNDGDYLYYARFSEMSFPNPASVAGILCNYATTQSIARMQAGDVGFSLLPTSNDVILYVSLGLLSPNSIASFKAYLSESPLQIGYRLAEPVTYQLTPQQLATLHGYNAVSTDAGTLSVTYRADPSITLGGG